MDIPNCQILITRLPYDSKYTPTPIFKMAENIDARGLICISMPIHVERPNNGGELIATLEKGIRGHNRLYLVAKCCWYRDRHIVTSKSKRLTNSWEPVAIFSRDKNYHMNRDAATKIKKGFENRESVFDEDEFQTCIGDHWPVRNDRRDRRYLPAGISLNCGQLGDLQPGDKVLDPYGNPGVRDACKTLGWQYVDGGLANPARKSMEGKENEEKNLLLNEA